MVKIAGFSIQTRTMTCQLDLTSQSGLKCHFLVLTILGVLPNISFTPLSLHPWGRLGCQKKQNVQVSTFQGFGPMFFRQIAYIFKYNTQWLCQLERFFGKTFSVLANHVKSKRESFSLQSNATSNQGKGTFLSIYFLFFLASLSFYLTFDQSLLQLKGREITLLIAKLVCLTTRVIFGFRLYYRCTWFWRPI